MSGNSSATETKIFLAIGAVYVEENLLSNLTLHQLVVHDLKPLDLTLKPAEITCLSGPSGSGKSLLLRAIADLIPHQGEMKLDGESSLAMKPEIWRKRVGLLMAESQWWADHVGEHFTHWDESVLKRLGFTPDIRDWQLARCSTGEKQRIALLRLLANQPQVLLLDEPTASLDRESVIKVETLIDDYRKQHVAPVLWVSHDQDQIRRVADRHLLIEQGEVIEVTV